MKKTEHAREAVPRYPTREEMNALARAGLIAVAVGSLSACSRELNWEGGQVINTLPVSGSSGKETGTSKETPADPACEKRTTDKEEDDAGLPRTCFPGVVVQCVDWVAPQPLLSDD